MSAFTFPVHNRAAQVENDVMSTDEHDDGTEAKPVAPAYDPATRSPQELEAMTLVELPPAMVPKE